MKRSKCYVWVGAALAVSCLGAGPALAETDTPGEPAPISLISADTNRGVLKVDDGARQASASLAAAQTKTTVVPQSIANFRPAAAAAVPSGLPVLGVRLSSSFGWRTHPVLGGGAMHQGVDLAGSMGAPVYATADGVIDGAEWFGSYGLYVQIDHGAGLQTRYAHMSQLAVSRGQAVQKGDVVGYVGSTGRSTGPHLHYEVRMGGEAVDPAPFMVLAQK